MTFFKHNFKNSSVLEILNNTYEFTEMTKRENGWGWGWDTVEPQNHIRK